jgi:hypothetical protein
MMWDDTDSIGLVVVALAVAIISVAALVATGAAIVSISAKGQQARKQHRLMHVAAGSRRWGITSSSPGSGQHAPRPGRRFE